jgi:hypothetical protein
MSIEAMKQALKFCEEIGDLRGPYPFVNETSIVSDSRKVLRALRQAIAEAEKQEPVAWIVDGEIKVRLDMAGKLYCSETNVYGKDVVNKAIEQEPVAFRNIETGEFCTGGFLRKDWAKWQPLYAAPVHASDISAERVDETAKDRHISYVCPNCHWSLDKQVRTHTPEDVKKIESKWVGLSDKEIKKIVDKNTSDIWCNGKGVARDVEDKLKEKNVPQP